jgi:aspartate/methionine/tyrosine aminotransferase
MRFSSRIVWGLKPNRLSQAVEAKRRAGVRILDLTESNPTAAGLQYPAGLLASLADPRALLYEPDPAGLQAAREQVSAYYHSRGVPVPPNKTLLTASTSESYSFLFKLLCDPGDEVLVPRPSYPLFEFLAALESVAIRSYPLVYDGEWSIDFERLKARLTPKTRAIVVVNPNNPTGSFLKRNELETLADLCGKHELALISDEVFSDYGFSPDDRRIETLAGVEEAPVFCLSGLSKVSALPQMKLGWLVANRSEAVERLEWIADTYLSVSTPVQYALRSLLAVRVPLQEQIRARLAANLRLLKASLLPELNVLNVEGGWYAVMQVPRVRSEEDWALLLLERADVLVQPGYFYDFETEAFLVVSLLTPERVFQDGMARLAETVREALV